MRLAVAVRRVVARFGRGPQMTAVRVAGAVRGQVRQWRKLGGHQEHAEQDGRRRSSQFPERRWVGAHRPRHDSSSDATVRPKVSDYLARGVRLVWGVDPKTKTVTTHTPRSTPVTLVEEGILDAGDVVPGFTCPVRRIFD